MEPGTVLDRTHERLATYTALRRKGMTPVQAAVQMQLSERSGYRYEQRRPAPVPVRPPSPAELVPVPEGGLRRGCGTHLAWLLHQALGEPACRVCLEAQYGRLRIPDFGAIRAADEAARAQADKAAAPALAARPDPPLVDEAEAACNRAVLAEAVNDLYTPRGRRRAKVAA